MASVGAFSDSADEGGGPIASVGTGLSLSAGVLTNPSVAATYLVQVASSDLSAEQAMGALATGLVKNAATTGVQSIAVPGTDYSTGLADAYYRALGIARLGLTAGDKAYGFLWDDFDRAASTTSALGWQVAATLTGTNSTLISGTKGGVHRISTGTTLASAEDAWQNSQLISALATQKWWLCVRQAVNTAVDAATIAATGFSENSGKTISIGVYGAGGGTTVNFSLQYDGNFGTTFADTGVAIDTAFHVFELYGKGDGKIYYRVDEGNEANVTPAALSALSQYIISTVRNGATAANRSLDRDFVACLYPR